MKRIEATFAKLKEEGRPALIPCLMAGDPDLAATVRAAQALAASGADMIELVIPFSDPIADGPTIQKAGLRALASGTTLPGVIRAAAEIREETELPIIMMSYLNPVLRIGLAEFARQAMAAGVDGVIVPELPVEEAGEWRKIAKDAGLDTVFLAAPTSSEERCRAICQASTGFVYAVTISGTTGARAQLPARLTDNLTRLKKLSHTPVVAGFGISTPETVKRLAPHADGLIVGSALIQLMEEGTTEEKIARVASRTRELRAALD